MRQWSSVLSQWSRLKSMNNDRINKRIFEWCEQNASLRCKNWNFKVNTMLQDSGVLLTHNINVSNYRSIKSQVTENLKVIGYMISIEKMPAMGMGEINCVLTGSINKFFSLKLTSNVLCPVPTGVLMLSSGVG